MTDDLTRLSRTELEAEVRRLRTEQSTCPTTLHAVNRRPSDRSTPAAADVLFSAVERTGLPMIITDPSQLDDPIIFANRAFQELSGYSADELLGRNCRFMQGPDTEQDRLTELRHALAENRDIVLEITNHRRDGTAFVNNLFVGPVYDADGCLLYRFGSQLDVTEVHRNRQRLAESEERQRAIFNSASEVAIVVTDTEGRVTDWNVGAERILGWSAEQMLGETIERIFTPEDRAAGRARQEMDSVLRDGQAEDVRWHLRMDGSRFYAVGDMTSLRGVDGTHRGFVKAMGDRTEQRNAEAKQQADAEFMRGVLASSVDCIKVLDLNGGLTFMSEGGMNVMEVSDFNDVKGCPWPDFWQGPGHADAKAALASAKAGGIGHFQGTADTYRGTPKWWDVQVTPIFGPDGRPERILSVSRDITDQKSFEARLASSEERWRGLFDGMQEGFFLGELVRDADGHATDYRFLEINPAFSRQSGLPVDSIGRTIRDLVPDIEQGLIDTYAGVVETGEPMAFEIDVPSLDRSFEVRATKERGDRFGCLFLDITDRRRADARRAATTELGDRLRDALTEREMITAASEIVGRTLDVKRASFGEIEGDVEAITIEPGWTAPGTESIAGRHQFGDYGDIRAHLLRGEPLVIRDVTTDPRTRADPAAMQAIDVASLINMPVRERGRTVAVFIAHDSKPRAWAPEELTFLRNVADRVQVGIARLRAEERQGVLNHELSHRMKNLLAMVQSIAAQTMRSASDMGEARDVLAGRLVAMGKAHDLLLGGSVASTHLAAVVRDALKVHQDQVGRFEISGPDVEIGADQALAVSLSLHELATNAAKYGALTTGEGRIAIGWEVVEERPEPSLRLTWVESGGPAVCEPTRKGFGSRFLERALAAQVRGELALAYPEAGMTFTLTAPLSAFQRTR